LHITINAEELSCEIARSPYDQTATRANILAAALLRPGDRDRLSIRAGLRDFRLSVLVGSRSAISKTPFSAILCHPGSQFLGRGGYTPSVSLRSFTAQPMSFCGIPKNLIVICPRSAAVLDTPLEVVKVAHFMQQRGNHQLRRSVQMFGNQVDLPVIPLIFV